MKVKIGMMLCRTFSWGGRQRRKAVSLPTPSSHLQIKAEEPHREDGGDGAEQQQGLMVSLGHL